MSGSGHESALEWQEDWACDGPILVSTKAGTVHTAIAQLCQHLSATGTRYSGTDLILRYEIKTGP